MDERPLTPKPDPIVFNKVEPKFQQVIPQAEPMPVTPTPAPVGKTNMERLKIWYVKNKKLAIALSILGISLLIAIILIIFSYKPSGTIKNNPASAPVDTVVTPVDLLKKCDAENQNVSISVPSDWNCTATTDSSKDLGASNGDISFTFPLDVQPALGCGINDTNCSAEILYSSAKVEQLKAYKKSGKISVLATNVILNSKSYIVNIYLKGVQSELTSSQKELIIKILENISINTSFSNTRTLTFNLDPVQVGPVAGTKSLSGSLVADREIVLIQKDKNSVSIAKGDTALVISSLYEWSGVSFIKSESIGTTPYLGDTYRVVQGLEGSELTYYVPKTQVTLTGQCGAVSSPVGSQKAPCGTVPTQGGYFFRCAGTGSTYDTNFCDSVMKQLTIALKNN